MSRRLRPPRPLPIDPGRYLRVRHHPADEPIPPWLDEELARFERRVLHALVASHLTYLRERPSGPRPEGGAP